MSQRLTGAAAGMPRHSPQPLDFFLGEGGAGGVGGPGGLGGSARYTMAVVPLVLL